MLTDIGIIIVIKLIKESGILFFYNTYLICCRIITIWKIIMKQLHLNQKVNTISFVREIIQLHFIVDLSIYKI